VWPCLSAVVAQLREVPTGWDDDGKASGRQRGSA
jgi:hypothetical protein